MRSAEVDGVTREASWPEYVARHRLVGALTAGFVAVTIATVTGFWFKGLGLDNMDWPTFNGMLLLPNASPNEQFVTGEIFHVMTGMAFTLVYCLVIHPKLPLPNTTAGNMGKAFIFAAVLTLISGLWWVPQLFDAGVFGVTFFGFKGFSGSRSSASRAWSATCFGTPSLPFISARSTTRRTEEDDPVVLSGARTRDRTTRS